MSSGLQAIFLSERPMLLRMLQVRLRSTQEAEDVLQDMWIRLEHLPAGPVADPAAYLYRMAANLATDRLRSSIRRALREANWVDSQACAHEQPLIDRTLIARERLRHVEAALATMPPRMQRAFHLYRFEELSRGEVARNMGISVSAVEKLLQRGYRHIHDAGRSAGVEEAVPERLSDERDLRHGR